MDGGEVAVDPTLPKKLVDKADTGVVMGEETEAPLAGVYFNYRKTSIYAGSNEIQRNIIAKMMLGL